MAVELTPRGTRGMNLPKLPRPLQHALLGLFHLLTRLRGTRVLFLTTVGARSGRAHQVPLSWFRDGENAWLVVASFGGTAQHPAWYINMAHHPDQVWIEIGGRKRRVQPESLHGAERAAAWQRITAVAPIYNSYQEKTDREIPVVRLRAVD